LWPPGPTPAASAAGRGVTGWRYTWALIRAGPGRAGPRKSPTQYSAAQARPGPTIGPQISAQARPVGLKNHRAVGPSGRAFSKSSFFPTQARPVTLVGPKYPAQARPDSMLWPDGPGHFRAGSGRADRAGLPMPSYSWRQRTWGCPRRV
jgi:hypothetical protein